MKNITKLLIFLLPVLFYADLYSQDITTGLIAYYPFNGNANDESGNGKHGTADGATLTIDKHGSADRAYQFDGNNDFIVINHAFGGSSELTISAWYNVASYVTGEFQSIVSSEDANFVHVQLNTSGNLSVNSNPNVVFPAPPFTPTNEWRHIVVSVKSGESKLYINNTMVGQSGVTFGSIPSSNPIKIGAGYQGLRNFNGKIDEVRIYNRALTAAEVTEIYYLPGHVSTTSFPEDQFKIFPNPVQNTMSIEIKSRETSSQNAKVEISDIYGKVLFTDALILNAGENRKELSLDKLESGIYYIHLISGNNVAIKKIVKL